MFDLGFSEILLVVIVALVVLGPKRMPKLVREVGRWVGKARAMARQFREQLESEVDLEEFSGTTKSSRTASTPAPPPELSGAPIAPGAESNSEHGGTYPYGAYPYAEAPPTEAPPASTPQPGDDAYSHAHAAGDAPLPYHPPDHAVPVAEPDPAANATATPPGSSAA